jgi:hypothetical protein
MADRPWRGGNGGDGGRDHKESMARQSSTSRASERSNGGARSSASPVANGAGGAMLRTFIEAFTIGRSRRCDLVIPTSDDTRTISKTHARIFPMRDGDDAPITPGERTRGGQERGQKWILQDLNTLNGTSINGMDLMPGGSMELHDGDELVLSSNIRTGIRLFVQVPDADQSRLVARLYGPGSGPRHHASPARVAETPRLWRGGSLPNRNGASPQPPPMTASPDGGAYSHRHRSESSSSLTKRQRSSDDHDNSTSRQSDNGQDGASAATHDSKRSRHEDTAADKERLMLCPVCLDYFSNSATLACSHTFCGHCISHWFRASSALSCPECRTGVRHMPVRNRALDDLVHSLVGDTDAYRLAVRKRTTEERMGAASSTTTGGFDLRTHPLIFSLWSSDDREAFSAFLGKQFGDARIAACRQIGLTEAAIDGASGAELHIATQNLSIDCADLRASHQACDRLKIYLH